MIKNFMQCLELEAVGALSNSERIRFVHRPSSFKILTQPEGDKQDACSMGKLFAEVSIYYST